MIVIVLTMLELSHTHTLLLTSSGECSSCTGFRHVGLDMVAFTIAGPHNGLIIS